MSGRTLTRYVIESPEKVRHFPESNLRGADVVQRTNKIS